GVAPQQAGLASGLLNTSQQIGGAIGVAVATTIFTTRSTDLLKTGHTPPQAFTSGYADAFWALFALALAGAVAAFVLLRGDERRDVTEQEAAGVAIEAVRQMAREFGILLDLVAATPIGW